LAGGLLFIVAIKLCECRWQVQNKLTYETEIAQVDETSVQVLVERILSILIGKRKQSLLNEESKDC
jgi:hypothetical protein